jgi:hypothetical protein
MPFKEMSPLQWSIILPLLRPCIFEAGQVLCTQGDYCIETYIILEGCLHGTCSAKRLIRILSGEHIRDARQTLKGRVVGASLLKRKTIMPQFMPNTANLNKEEEDEEDVKTRCIQAGDTVNVLCMLGIWEMAVETVVATETGDSYLINAEEFLSYFSSHSIFEILRQHTVETMFEMANDPDAPTKYGIPLWPLQEEEVFARDAEYLRRKAAEKEASYGKLSENMKLKMKAQKTKRPRETNDQSARSSTIKTMSSKSVISKLRLKGSNLQSAAQQAEELNKRLKKKAGLLASIQKSSARVLTDTDGPTSLFSPTRYSPFKRSSSSDQQSDEKPSVWDDNSQKASSISKKKVSPLPIPSRSISTP